MSKDIELNPQELQDVKSALIRGTWSSEGFAERIEGWRNDQWFLTGVIPFLAEYSTLAYGEFKAPANSLVGNVVATRRYQPIPSADYDDTVIAYTEGTQYVRLSGSWIQIFDSEAAFDQGGEPKAVYRAFDVDGAVHYIPRLHPGEVIPKPIAYSPAHLNYLALRAQLSYNEANLKGPIYFIRLLTRHLSKDGVSGNLHALDHYRSRPEHIDWLKRVHHAFNQQPLEDPKIIQTFAEEFAELTSYVIPKHKRRTVG